MEIMGILTLVNLFFAVVIGLYFWNLLRQQQTSRSAVERESRKELEKLAKLKAISLTEPLAEKTRPSRFEEIVGQEDGLKALRAALCGPNPQHVIIYGPPGVGKTAAARLVLEEAKRNPLSPFGPSARFVEVDATTARFDDRGIADPLLGSVHDPIYQGAGPLGIAGIPQPKPGAVTKAHGGILFIDEIGELHPIQMNKLLKVLEDRKVFLESAYYSAEDKNIPPHIHEIFQKGLPADFRLVGATTRMPHEIPPAIRSRCLEVFFRALRPDEVARIAKHAAEKAEFAIDEGALDVIRRYAANGREAVNMVQLAGGTALAAGRRRIFREDVEWVVSSGQYSPCPEPKVPDEPQVGAVNGLAVFGPNLGAVIEVEATAIPTRPGEGKLVITGVMEEEEIGRLRGDHAPAEHGPLVGGQRLDCAAAEPGPFPQDYDIHVNFPGAVPVDGPSAGAAMVTAIYSAITGIPVKARCAMTGEVSIRGAVRPVGGIVPKLEAAKEAGVDLVFIPEDNWQQRFAAEKGMAVRPVRRIHQVVKEALVELPRAASLRRALEAEEAGAAEEGGRAEPCPVTV